MPVPMRLGLDADPVGRDGSGNETYLRGIIGALQQQLTAGESMVLAGRNPAALHDLAAPGVDVIGIPEGLRGELALGRALHRAGATIALCHYTAAVGFRGPIATVVHDIAFRRLPETFPIRLRLQLRLTVRRSIRRSAMIVMMSQFTREELLKTYRSLRPDQVIVTGGAPLPVFAGVLTDDDLDDIRARLELPHRFVLAVNALDPRKNLARLVAASGHWGVPLLIVGARRRLKSPPTALAAGAPADAGGSADVRDPVDTGHVRWLGHVPDRDLAGLYRLCSVFAYPSLYEGFGLPVVEAMASGAPVVTSDGSALREVAGDAALLVDPTSVEAIAAGIERVLGEPRLATELGERGRIRAASFSWEASAAALLKGLRPLAARATTTPVEAGA